MSSAHLSRSSIAVGVHQGIASGDYLSTWALGHWWEQGMRMLMGNADIGAFRSGCRQMVRLRAFLGE